MRALRLFRPWSVGALFALSALSQPLAAMGQANAIQATLFFPPGVTGFFSLNAPIPIVVQLTGAQVTNGQTVVPRGTFDVDLLGGFLYFDGPQGLISATHAAHREIQPVQCRSQSGAILVTPIPVVPIEADPVALPPLEQDAPNVKTAYDVAHPGRWKVNFRFPLLTFDALAVTSCDQVVGPVVNVGTGGGGTGVTVVSPFVEFCVVFCTFDGFLDPLQKKSTFNFGSTILVKFRLLDVTNAAVGTTDARIRVQQLPGGTPSDLGSFRFNPNQGHHNFSLDTSVLAPGFWRLSAVIGGFVVKSVEIELRP